MAEWNEIAEDHHIALSWSGGLNRDGNGYPLSPPSDDPSMSGGLNTYFSQQAQTRMYTNPYRCKFCDCFIEFVDRRPYNPDDGSAHRCLAVAAENRRRMNPTAVGDI